jgi:uncharacterized small protein (DUF1192 family)
MDERAPALRRALVDAIAAAHRLRQQAATEEREAERWQQRAAYAEERGLDDLGIGARSRVLRHTHMAQLLDQRAAEMRAEVQRLRAELDASAGGGRPPPVLPALSADPLAARFADLEVEQELDRLRAARSADRSAAQPPHSDSQ